MARAFTTPFSYNGYTYTAVISEFNGIVNIYVPDESLHTIFPAGRATFNPQERLEIDTPGLSTAQHLVLNILSSIDKQSEAEFLTQKESNHDNF